ncbi:capsular exopolysaccharide synthesis family protein [Runella defluvii]|uniref:non-specific protein-tyrosine kinase n=1 Tax=Runella defluvii TaxID=370973 RepID=A0A7W5ZGL6_9BACT|nr:tyrosine-protein kinase family protein [Runella defluvii]MBB3836423.1 capsular exopolysaccharide synthesis family protein [Runella defluvii]
MEDFEISKDQDFNLRLIIFKYLRYWYWFILSLFFSLAVSYFYLQYTTPIYRVSASLLIKDEKKGMTSGNQILKDLEISGGSKIVENEIEILKSRNLIENVINELNLTVGYYEEGRFRDSELFKKSPITLNYTQLQNNAYQTPLYIQTIDNQHYRLLNQDKNNLGTYLYTQPVNSGYGRFRVFISKKEIIPNQIIKIFFYDKENLIESLTQQLQVNLLNTKSTVLEVGLETNDPDKGKIILAKLLDAYSYSSLQDKNREASNTMRFIEERLKLITGELVNVEKDVETYKSSQGITDLSTEANLFLEKVKDNDTKLNEVDIQLKVLDGVERYLQSGQGQIAPATLMVTDPILTSFIEKLGELELQKEKVSRSVQPGNPFLETLNTQISNTKQAIRESVNNQKKGLSITKSGLQSLNTRFETTIRAIPRKEREFVSIQRQQNIKENLYLILLQKREETALSYASTVTDSRIIDLPHSTSSPIKPRKRTIYLISFLIGFIFPILVLHLKEMLNDKVQTKKEIEQETSVSIFGEIALKPKEVKSPLLDTKSRSFITEQFRILRTNLQYINSNSNNDLGRVILFTSSNSGEGKSFVTLNLAASIAALGKKVVVLELDLRKPKLSDYLSLPRDHGITNYLIGNTTPDSILQKTGVDNLSLIATGPLPPNPSELLSNGRIKSLLELYRQQFDYILIDTPPVGLVTDAVILSPLIDACFYIVRHDMTPKRDLLIVSELKKNDKFKSISIIFNGVNYRNSREYRYGYGYGTKYGKGYY